MSVEPTGPHEATLSVAKATASREHQAFELEVLEGPDRGLKLSIDPADPEQAPRLLLGTSPACQLRLSDRTVSRRHAALDSDGLRLRLTDLSSTNGTRVNGVAIVEAFLSGNETVELGQTSLVLRPVGLARAGQTDAQSFGRLLGQSEEMQRLHPICQKIAQSDVPVLLEGDTGTGKELLAESIHELGPRAAAPFVVFDCAGVPASQAEAMLFGQAAGPNGSGRRGVFEEADGGTLLIDEVAELDPALQPQLLRVLERGELRPLGSARTIKVNARLLFATRRDLDREVQAGRFRDDLFFRMAVARIELPPLRRRSGDVELLARHFWRSLGGEPGRLDARFLRALTAYDWPGNVRELRNAVARRIALGEVSEAPLSRPSLPDAAVPRDWLEELLDQKLPLTQTRQQVLDVFLRRYVERTLAEHGGNVSRAAEASGLARRYFQLLRARQRNG